MIFYGYTPSFAITIYFIRPNNNTICSIKSSSSTPVLMEVSKISSEKVVVNAVEYDAVNVGYRLGWPLNIFESKPCGLMLRRDYF